MRVKIVPAQQIQRINQLESQLDEIQNLPKELLQLKPSNNEWSIIEVVKHMTIAHQAYQSKIKDAIVYSTPKKEVKSEYKTSFIPSYLIKRFPPIKGQIKMKMKTMKKFEPIINDDMELNEVINEFKNTLLQLKQWINLYRTQSFSLKKFNSAIGPMVRFNIPEACEFILCHNERHFHQIKKVLDSIEA